MMSSGKNKFLLQFFFNESSIMSTAEAWELFLWKIQNGFWELKEN